MAKQSRIQAPRMNSVWCKNKTFRKLNSCANRYLLLYDVRTLLGSSVSLPGITITVGFDTVTALDARIFSTTLHSMVPRPSRAWMRPFTISLDKSKFSRISFCGDNLAWNSSAFVDCAYHRAGFLPFANSTAEYKAKKQHSTNPPWDWTLSKQNFKGSPLVP